MFAGLQLIKAIDSKLSGLKSEHECLDFAETRDTKDAPLEVWLAKVEAEMKNSLKQ
jgi:hypothetical protein